MDINLLKNFEKLYEVETKAFINVSIFCGKV